MNIRPYTLIGLVAAVCLMEIVTGWVLPGLIFFAWTPVWAAYALWQHLLRRQSTKLPPAAQFDQEFQDLLEKEGKK